MFFSSLLHDADSGVFLSNDVFLASELSDVLKMAGE